MKTKAIIDHIADLYGISEKENQKMVDNTSEYRKAFDSYNLEDIIKSIDEYWRFKSDKIRPTLAKILAMLNSDKESVSNERHNSNYEKISRLAADLEYKFGVGARNRFVRNLIDNCGVELKFETEKDIEIDKKGMVA